MRNPRLGRFNQPDPIGYGDGMNLYAYVGGDPLNAVDPSGTLGECAGTLIYSICGDAAEYAARNLVQKSEMGGWSAAGRSAAVDMIANYLLGKGDSDTLADALYESKDSETLAASVASISRAASSNFDLASGLTGTSIRAAKADSEGYTDFSSFTMERGLGAKLNEAVISDFGEIKLITRFMTVIQCARCVGPLFGGSYDVKFLNPARGQIGGTGTVVGRIGIAGVTKFSVPPGAHYVQFVPTILTPPSTQVIARGRRKGW